MLFLNLSGQNSDALQSKKEKLYDELNYKNEVLKDTRVNKQSSVSELKILKTQLKTQEDLVKTIKEQIGQSDTRIEELGVSIVQKEADVLREQEEYAKMIRHAYNNKGSQQFLVFLLSAETFNDAFRRLQYIRKYNAYRLEKVANIESQKKELDKEQTVLIQEKETRESALEEQAQAQQRLLKDQKEKSRIVEDLQSQEKKLEQEVDQKRVAIASLEKQIKSIIRANTQAKSAPKPKPKPKAKEPIKTQKTTEPQPTPKPEIKKTPEVAKLASSFSKNKGKLPWPVENGVITSYFGEQSHSEISSLKIDNAGIDIATKKGTKAKAVFPGKVRSVLFSPIFQSAIIVQHGDYYTVYSNIEVVEVEKGQELKRGDQIGTVHTNKSGITEVHFEVYKADVNLNPYSWLKRK